MKPSTKKRAVQKKPPSEKSAKKTTKPKKPSKIRERLEESAKRSARPADEVVTYAEIEFDLREISAQGNKVLIGPPWLTRFERARITGSRSLQLSLGAPPMIKVPPDANSSIALSVAEIEHKVLPISIRRILPNGQYQDIPIDWMR